MGLEPSCPCDPERPEVGDILCRFLLTSIVYSTIIHECLYTGQVVVPPGALFLNCVKLSCQQRKTWGSKSIYTLRALTQNLAGRFDCFLTSFGGQNFCVLKRPQKTVIRLRQSTRWYCYLPCVSQYSPTRYTWQVFACCAAKTCLCHIHGLISFWGVASLYGLFIHQETYKHPWIHQLILLAILWASEFQCFLVTFEIHLFLEKKYLLKWAISKGESHVSFVTEPLLALVVIALGSTMDHMWRFRVCKFIHEKTEKKNEKKFSFLKISIFSQFCFQFFREWIYTHGNVMSGPSYGSHFISHMNRTNLWSLVMYMYAPNFQDWEFLD